MDAAPRRQGSPRVSADSSNWADWPPLSDTPLLGVRRLRLSATCPSPPSRLSEKHLFAKHPQHSLTDAHAPREANELEIEH